MIHRGCLGLLIESIVHKKTLLFTKVREVRSHHDMNLLGPNSVTLVKCVTKMHQNIQFRLKYGLFDIVVLPASLHIWIILMKTKLKDTELVRRVEGLKLKRKVHNLYWREARLKIEYIS